MTRVSVRTFWIGAPESGKTSLLTSYTKNIFPQQYVPSVYENYTAQVDNFLYEGTKRNINLIISSATVDDETPTAKNEEEYEPQSDVVVIVCAIDSPESFKTAEKDLIPKAKTQLPGKPVIIVGTKTDLRKDEGSIQRLAAKNEHPVTLKEGMKLAKRAGIQNYIECSAKELGSVKAVFEEVLKEHFKNEARARKEAARKTSSTCFGAMCLKGGDAIVDQLGFDSYG